MKTTVLLWNINEGKDLAGAASHLREASADIVLLNEIRGEGFWKSDQTRYLAQASGYLNFQYRNTTMTGITTKGVAILSRHPITHTRFHRLGTQLPFLDNWYEYGTIQCTMVIRGLLHEVFSTRFAPMHDPSHSWYDPQARTKNRVAHEQTRSMIQGIPSSSAVILGGDFNASWDHAAQTPWAGEFRRTSGLREALLDGGQDLWGRVDYLYYRGPYMATHAVHRGVPGQISDHGYILATLTRTDIEADDGAFVRQSVPSQAEPAQAVDVTLTFRNTGSTRWSPGGYLLMAADPPDNPRWGPRRVDLVSAISPGEDATFAFAVRAPSTQGRYPFVWQMARRDNGKQFGERSKRIDVSVAPQQVRNSCLELKERLDSVNAQIRSLQDDLRFETGAMKWYIVRQISVLQGSASGIKAQMKSLNCQ